MEENNNFLYKGYLLVIELCILGWSSKCKELDYSKTSSSIPTLKKNFMKFVDEKLEKERKMTEDTNKSTKETFTYKGFTVEILTLGMAPGIGWIYGGQCKDVYFGVSGYLKKSDVIDAAINVINSKLKEKGVEEVSTTEDRDKKIAELVKVIDGLNKKLEEKDKKIERLKNKIATVKFEINKAE